MAIDGQAFRSVHAAVATIDSVLGSASRQARQAGMGGPQSLLGARFPESAQLVRVDDAAFELSARRTFADLAWFDDKWCSGRSLVVAQDLADTARFPLAAGLRGFGPARDAVAGAVATIDGPFRLAGGGRWSYHAVGVGWPASSPVPLAIDGALFTRPVPLAAWAQRVGARSEDVVLRHPWDLRGLSIAPSLDGGIEAIRTNLARSVQAVGETRPIDNPFVRGASIVRVGAGSDDAGRGAAYLRHAARLDG